MAGFGRDMSLNKSPGIDRSNILHPFNAAEAMGTAEAAQMADVAQRTMRDLCLNHAIARQILGHWKVSRVALQMLLDGDQRALEAYAAGDKTSFLVAEYFEAVKSAKNESVPVVLIAGSQSTP